MRQPAKARRQAGVATIEFVFCVWPLLLVVAWLIEYASVQLDEYRVQDLAIATAEAISDAKSAGDAAQLAQNLIDHSAPVTGVQQAGLQALTFSGPVQYGTIYEVVVSATHRWLFLPFAEQIGPATSLRAAAYGVISRRNLGT